MRSREHLGPDHDRLLCAQVGTGDDFQFRRGTDRAPIRVLPAFILAASETIWARFAGPNSPRHHHGIFAMMYPLAGVFPFTATNSPSCNTPRQLGGLSRKWLALGRALPVPVSLHQREGVERCQVTGRYVPVTVEELSSIIL
jgi:hypothetical protein